jgi:hypothetical protein
MPSVENRKINDTALFLSKAVLNYLLIPLLFIYFYYLYFLSIPSLHSIIASNIACTKVKRVYV